MKNLLNRAILCVCAFALWSSVAHAQDNRSATYVTLANLVFYSAQDKIYPQYAGTVSIELTSPITWVTPTGCATGVVEIRGTDVALISAAQTALATGRPVEIFVDDSQTVDGVVCFVRALEY